MRILLLVLLLRVASGCGSHTHPAEVSRIVVSPFPDELASAHRYVG
jgi:hypothetical protein